ncbi:stk19 superfamily domain-containing protein, conidia-enriched transcript [Histoplasma ohiense]|nr:stk19 superfamily domain-containing protein, conidia-enriched transcript [Histoplasma ohiense (nom. inval.)]
MMPLHFTAAQSSRIRKSSGTQLSGRQSPFSRHSRAKPFRSPLGRTALDSDNDIHSGYYKDSILPDIGPSQYISETTELTSVIQAIQYIRNTMFSDLPQRAGMNSTRIAEVLNFRRALPPIVSVAHVHMLLNAPTKVEREIVELVDSARVRKLFIPGRGFDSAGLGDCLILVQDWEDTVRSSSSVKDDLKEKFLELLRKNTKTSAVAAGIFTPEETSSLVRAGFLVSPSSLAKHPSFDTSPTSIPASRRSHALNIVLPGQEIAVSDQRKSGISSMFLSIPNLGPYLRLVGAARTQIITLLKKSRSGEAPLTLIRDRWDGAVESEVYYNVSKRARGESAGVLPGKTKKWKELYGMNFRWALEEALGSGLIELFDTGSVGPGVRRV